MAKRRVAQKTRTKSGTEIVVFQQPGGGMQRRRRRARGGGGGSKKRRRRRHHSGGGSLIGGSGIQGRVGGTFVGGLIYGFLIKAVPQIPSLPLIGRSGAVALGVALLKPTNRLIQDVGIAAAAIAGMSLGSTGAVSGVGDDSEQAVLTSEG